MGKINVGVLIYSIFIPLLVGGLSAALTAKSMIIYGSMNKPPLSPPAWAFPVAWTLLYIMMGLASYFVIVAQTDAQSKRMALILYGVQLAMNFMWSIIFFLWGMYLLAFIWLMIMWLLIIICAARFYDINRTATYLFIPYIVWITFAAYLNFGSYLLNMRSKY